VVVRKQAEERTETVRDTVRKTEVEVENTPGAARPATPTETTTTTETTRKPR
jgi:stress response protein YsnF